MLFSLLAAVPPFRLAHTHIIATLRADYLPELFALPALYDIAKHGIDLRAMGEAELKQAIQQPLRVAYPDVRKRYEPELVDRLAHDAAENTAYLPLLQVTLEEIWNKGSLTLGAYGSLTEAIKQRADKVIAVDQTIRIWDVAGGGELFAFRAHASFINSADFSPDGQRIVTSSYDNTARVWDATTGRELLVLRGHTSAVTDAAYSPDGRMIVTASRDGTAQVYLTRIEDLIALARTRVARELTCQERQTYLHENITCP